MANSVPIKIGNMEFSSKAAARRYASVVLHRYEKNELVGATDIPFVEGLLDRHPNRVKKIGPGLAAFEIGSGKFNEKCFVVRRTDGSVAAFSYKKAINTDPAF